MRDRPEGNDTRVRIDLALEHLAFDAILTSVAKVRGDAVDRHDASLQPFLRLRNIHPLDPEVARRAFAKSEERAGIDGARRRRITGNRIGKARGEQARMFGWIGH